jgi:Methyltransferase domain.
MIRLIKRFADNREMNSLATTMRRRRFALFIRLLNKLPRPITILDVGGTQRFWETMRFADSDVLVVLLNITAPAVTLPNFIGLAGDARDMHQFADDEFDVVFSNSVIEHVGDFANQRRMASEIRRVGKRYFVQTPSRSFPIEPHFLYPYFQFWPMSIRVAMLSRWDVGWWKRIPDPAAARAELESIQLLSARQMRELFPDGTIYRERLLGLTKSYIAYGGWE